MQTAAVIHHQHPVAIFRPDPPAAWRGLSGLSVQASPLAFLAQALTEPHEHLVICFPAQGQGDPGQLVELCALLRHAPLTQSVPLGCVLQDRQRDLLIDLAQAGVGWVACPAPERPLLPLVLTAPGSLASPWEPISSLLDQLCPHLAGKPLADGRRMAVCGAHHNRLVLSRQTQETLCQRGAHRQCPHFLDPNGELA